MNRDESERPLPDALPASTLPACGEGWAGAPESGFDAAVVIPTHNRAGSLRRVLQALAAQTYDMRRVEVIVVADGCVDGTIAMLRDEDFGLRLKVIDQPQSGVATTRNRGAAEATAPLLIFLDDDVRPSPGFVAAHLAIQAIDGACVSIGHLAPNDEERAPGWWRWFEWQLEKQYAEMIDGTRPVNGLALYSGNFAAPREYFEKVGGFDTQMRTCEDTDLGIRMQGAGAAFRLNLDAVGWHSGYHDYASWKRTAYRDGAWDAETALKLKRPFGWAELLEGFRDRHPWIRTSARLLLDRKRAFALGTGAMKLAASVAGALHLYGVERYLYAGIYGLIYWQAVSDGLGGSALLWRYLRAPQTVELAA